MLKTKHRMRNFALFCLSFFIAAIFFTFNYFYNNKYTLSAPQAVDGTLQIYESTFSNNTLIPLINGWRIYPDQLLAPNEIAGNSSFQRINLGDKKTFSSMHSSGTPLGSATYVYNLKYQSEPLRLSIFIPEIFSSYHLYLNDVLATSCGDPIDYTPFLQYRLISFVLEGDTQIVFQVSNQTHYYFGMRAAPVIGTQSSIMYLALSTLCLSAFCCFSSLALCLFTLGLWITQRRHLHFTFGSLALSFALYISYPLFFFFGVNQIKAIFCLKNLSFVVMLVCALAVTAELCGVTRHPYIKAMIVICGFYALWIVLLAMIPPAQMSSLNELLNLASNAFLLLMAGSIFWCVLHSATQESLPTLLVVASNIFALGLLANYFGFGKFEPIRFLWPIDYCAGLLMCCFSVLMAKESFRLAHENRHLTEHLEEEVALRTHQLEALSEERKRFLADVSHDLKAPLSAIHSYMELIRFGNLQLDKETQSYLEVIEQKSDEMTRRVTTLQTFSNQELPTGPKERIVVSSFLMEVYRSNQPDADAQGIYFVFRPATESLYFFGWPDKCARVLENLIYNALSFTPEGGKITLGAKKQGDSVLITVADTGIGIPKTELEHIFEQGVSLRSASTEQRGLGLYFARNTVRELGGELFARNLSTGGAEFCILLPLCP